MTSSWNYLEGVALAGDYALEQWLGEADGNSAFFLTRFQGQPAILKLMPAAMNGDQQLEHWEWISRLSHPNLLRLLDCGRAEAADESFVFAVFENPDDTLATAIEHGRLSEAETRDVLTAALAALEYIHSQGLVHTSLDPRHIVAVGNQIKLSSDTLRPSSREATTADDVRSLGALVYELLTQRVPAGSGETDVSSIPEPLASIIQHALDPDPSRRWTLRQITEALNPPAPARSLPEPAVHPHQEALFDGLEQPRAFAKWPFIAAAVLAAALIGYFAVSKRSLPAQPAVARVTPAAAATQPEPPAPPQTTVPKPRQQPRGEWRVIAYTYSGLANAEKKARSINEKWRGAQAEVFTPNGPNRPPYLISLGGQMSRAEAQRLQKRARSKGMPRDTFIRNYPR